MLPVLFLLKRNLAQGNARDDRLYGCMLCTLAGKPGRQFSGEGHLLEHVFHHQHQVYGDVPLVGPLSIESEADKAATVQDFDVLFDRGEDFALPPSMLDDNQSLESIPLKPPEEAFGNARADQTPGGRRRSLIHNRWWSTLILESLLGTTMCELTFHRPPGAAKEPQFRPANAEK